MPVDPNIPLSVQTPAPQDPMTQYGKVLALQGAIQGQKVQAAQLTGLNQENQMRDVQMQQMQTLNNAYRSALTIGSDGSASIDTGKLTNALAAGGAGNRIPDVLKGVTAYQQSVANLAETHTKVAAAQADAMGSVGSALQKANYDPQLYLTLAQHAIDAKAVDPRAAAGPIQQVQQSLLQDPSGNAARAIVKQIADNAVQMSEKQQTLLNQAKSAQGSSDRGTAALQNSNRLQGEQDLKNASVKLGTAQTQAQYEAILGDLPKKIADKFPDSKTFDPKTTPAAALAVGATPGELLANTRAAGTAAATDAYRKATLSQGAQRINIEQQNADTNAAREQKGPAAANPYSPAEIDKQRKILDGVHQQRTAIGAALATENGEQYVDPKTGRLAATDMNDSIRATLTQQMQNVTNQGRGIISKYAANSGGRINSNELPAAPGQSQQPGNQPQKAAPAPENTVITNGQGVRMKKIGGQWKTIDADGNPVTK
jgi:hypothetical protein